MGTLSRNKLKIIVFVFGVIILAVSLVTYSGIIKRSFEDEIYTLLRQSSEQSAEMFKKEIEGDLGEIQDIAIILANKEPFDADAAVEILRKITDENDFKRMGILFKDGTGVNTDNVCFNHLDREYFKIAVSGKTNLSDLIIDYVDGSKINVYASPIIQHDEVIAVLFATHDMEVFRSITSISTFDGKGYMYVVKKNGDVVMPSENKTAFADCENIFDSMLEVNEANYDATEKMRVDMLENGNDVVVFNNKIDKFMYYEPIGINDWYLLSVVPVDIVNSRMNYVMICSYTLCAVILLVLTALVWEIFAGQGSRRKILEQIVYTDEITGGNTYAGFRKKAVELLNKGSAGYFIADLDVDKFKFINDAFGYDEGNKVIKFISEMIKAYMGDMDLFAHRSADRFVMLLRDDKEQIVDRVNKICLAISENRRKNNIMYELLLSVGLYEIIGDKSGNFSQADIDKMVDRAEIARKTVKGQLSRICAVYDDAIRKRKMQDKYIEDRMVAALENGSFYIMLQPKYNMDGKISGSESLVRWHDKILEKVIPPNEFISVFESNGFIVELDKYVFEQTCIEIRSQLDLGLKALPVSVNLSQIQLYNTSFIDEYVKIMKKYDIPSELIEIELTESALFDNANAFSEIVGRLHHIGFSILMDDFGTGYSSLNMLKTIAVDVVKLDKSFVDTIGDKKGERIIAAIIMLAHDLNMTVTAEGVETAEQFEFLKKNSCDEIQGYFFSKPLNILDFRGLLDKR